MRTIGQKSFGFFLVLACATAVIFCLPSNYGWAWGAAIQIWALFGLWKLYVMSEPAPAEQEGETLSMRLSRSLFSRRQHEQGTLTERLSHADSMAVLVLGGAVIFSLLVAGYQGFSLSGALSGNAYALLYLIALSFCLGVIAFLAQLYAVRGDFTQVGLCLLLLVFLGALVLAFGRHGLAAEGGFPLRWWMEEGRGTWMLLHTHEGLSPFAFRVQMMGGYSAFLPWLVMMPICLSFLAALAHPQRKPVGPMTGLMIIAGLVFYDLYAVRDLYHYAVIIPGWTAVCLAWGRSGYGPQRLTIPLCTSRWRTRSAAIYLNTI